MPRSIELRNYMVRHPVTVTPEMSIFEASHKILEYKLSGVCVVDHDNNLLGVLSELDCLKAIVEKVYKNGEEDAGIVADVMTHNVEVNHPHDQITNVATSMLDHKHRRRPVVIDGKLVGQVTCRQILKAIKEFAVPVDATEAN
jgi:CBS domain-containing protein